MLKMFQKYFSSNGKVHARPQKVVYSIFFCGIFGVLPLICDGYRLFENSKDERTQRRRRGNDR